MQGAVALFTLYYFGSSKSNMLSMVYHSEEPTHSYRIIAKSIYFQTGVVNQPKTNNKTKNAEKPKSSKAKNETKKTTSDKNQNLGERKKQPVDAKDREFRVKILIKCLSCHKRSRGGGL